MLMMNQVPTPLEKSICRLKWAKHNTISPTKRGLETKIGEKLDYLVGHQKPTKTLWKVVFLDINLPSNKIQLNRYNWSKITPVLGV